MFDTISTLTFRLPTPENRLIVVKYPSKICFYMYVMNENTSTDLDCESWIIFTLVYDVNINNNRFTKTRVDDDT